MNFVGVLIVHVSQGSVATYVRCGGVSTVTAQSLVASFFGTQCTVSDKNVAQGS